MVAFALFAFHCCCLNCHDSYSDQRSNDSAFDAVKVKSCSYYFGFGFCIWFFFHRKFNRNGKFRTELNWLEGNLYDCLSSMNLPSVVEHDLVGFASVDAMMGSAFVAMMAVYRLYSAVLDVIVVVMIALTCHHRLLILCSNSSAHYISIYLDSEIPQQRKKQNKNQSITSNIHHAC